MDQAELLQAVFSASTNHAMNPLPPHLKHELETAKTACGIVLDSYGDDVTSIMESLGWAHGKAISAGNSGRAQDLVRTKRAYLDAVRKLASRA